MLRKLFIRFCRSRDGAVSIEGAIIGGIMIVIIGAALEMGYAFFQWNTAQQAARVGARIAITSDPVTTAFDNMTGLSGSVDVGDPMPAYSFTCTGGVARCSAGQFTSAAFNRIFYGRDSDGACEATSRERRGLCDMFPEVDPKHVSVTYQNSGFGTAGNPAQIVPLITVKLSGLRFNFVFLDKLVPNPLSTMPDISVSMVAEDLKSGR